MKLKLQLQFHAVSDLASRLALPLLAALPIVFPQLSVIIPFPMQSCFTDFLGPGHFYLHPRCWHLPLAGARPPPRHCRERHGAAQTDLRQGQFEGTTTNYSLSVYALFVPLCDASNSLSLSLALSLSDKLETSDSQDFSPNRTQEVNQDRTWNFFLENALDSR